MSAPYTLNRSVAGAMIACGILAAAPPAVADPIAWASWSNVATGTNGSATATFAAAGVTASYAGELRQFVANYPSYMPVGTFSGGSIDNPPPQANGIIQIFGGNAEARDTITFSQAVLNR